MRIANCDLMPPLYLFHFQTAPSVCVFIRVKSMNQTLFWYYNVLKKRHNEISCYQDRASSVYIITKDFRPLRKPAAVKNLKIKQIRRTINACIRGNAGVPKRTVPHYRMQTVIILAVIAAALSFGKLKLLSGRVSAVSTYATYSLAHAGAPCRRQMKAVTGLFQFSDLLSRPISRVGRRFLF